MTNEEIDAMDIRELAWNISTLLLANGADEVPALGEELEPAFRKILKALVKILPKRTI